MALFSCIEREMEQTFREVQETGISLLNPPSSTEELLKLLDKSEKLMGKMEQSSSELTKQALFPMMRALKSHGLFRSSDTDVKMSVLSCISEMIRITAPDAPYNDGVLKEFFHMLVPAFAGLSEMSTSRSYGKAASVLEIAADVRFCLLMLDLELDKLVIEMFQLFLKTIRSNHPNSIFNHMESVMTMVVDESEYISLELLGSLLASVRRRENQNISPASWKLGERVLRNCAAKLQSYIKKAVQSSVISLDDYFQIVTSICESGHISEEDHVVTREGEHKLENRTTEQDELSPVAKISILNDGGLNEISQAVEEAAKSAMRDGSSPNRNDETLLNENLSRPLEPCHLSNVTKSADPSDITEVDKLDSMKIVQPKIDCGTTPRKRNWKPNTKTLPDEGYSHYWDPTEKKSRCRKSHEKGIGHSHSSRKVALPSTQDQVTDHLGCSPKVSEIRGAASLSQNGKLPEGSSRRRGRPKKNRIMLNEDGDISIPLVSKVDFPKAQIKEEILESADVYLEKEPDNTNSLEPSQADLSIRDEFLVKDAIKRKRKRKPTVGKEEASIVADADEQLIGKKIKVWWPLDKKFYVGSIHSFDHKEKKHKVLYTDGEEETLNLKEERWELIGDDFSQNGEQETDLPKPDASSCSPPKKRRNRKSALTGQSEEGSSPKRRRPRAKKVEVDTEPDNPSTNGTVNGTDTSSKPSTSETVTISNVHSSNKLNGTNSKSATPEAAAVSKAKKLKKSCGTSTRPDTMMLSEVESRQDGSGAC